MRSVQRSPEPDFLADIRESHTQWAGLRIDDRVSIRNALRQDFGPVCAYCQQSCKIPTGNRSPDFNEETIDHFRPRHGFPDEQFNWLNLLYACRRCNQYKEDKWPNCGDSENQRLAWISRYRQVSEYINPNDADGRRPAQEFFNFDFDTGKIKPAEELDDSEWSIACRTISDIDLNDSDSGLEGNDQRHLMFQRRYQLSLLMDKFNPADIGEWVQAAQDAMQPGNPFSAYISAYIRYLRSNLGPLFDGLDMQPGPP